MADKALSQQSSLCWERWNYTQATNAGYGKVFSIHGSYDSTCCLCVWSTTVLLLKTGHILDYPCTSICKCQTKTCLIKHSEVRAKVCGSVIPTQVVCPNYRDHCSTSDVEC